MAPPASTAGLAAGRAVGAAQAELLMRAIIIPPHHLAQNLKAEFLVHCNVPLLNRTALMATREQRLHSTGGKDNSSSH